MKPILLFGKTGQVGKQFLHLSGKLGDVHAVGRADCDLTDAAFVRELILRAAPNCVVNAAAYTAVDRAETEEAACFAVNAAAPGAMAAAAAELGIPLIHYSTDYVFDGEKKGPYTEDDPTGPLGVYGRSKLEGEQRIAERMGAAGAYAILRTSWVFGAEGHNFMRTMLRLGAERPELKIVADQVGAPTSARAIAEATVQLLERNLIQRPRAEQLGQNRGVYHMTAGGSTSWFGFAERIFEMASAARFDRRPRVLPIATSEYPTAARRPRNSVLSNDKFAAAFGFRLRPWEELLQEEMLHIFPAIASIEA
jgi:dTDP-4-dehydrorhamnose reductase